VLVVGILILGLYMVLDLPGYMHVLRRRQRGMELAFTPEDRRLARGEDSRRIMGDEPFVERLALRVYLTPWRASETPRAEVTRNPTTLVLCAVVAVAAFLTGYSILCLPTPSRNAPSAPEVSRVKGRETPQVAVRHLLTLGSQAENVSGREAWAWQPNGHHGQG
jgi:hypothetical protein